MTGQLEWMVHIHVCVGERRMGAFRDHWWLSFYSDRVLLAGGPSYPGRVLWTPRG